MISTRFRCRTGRNYAPKTQICITRAQSCYPTCFGVREAAGFTFHCKTLGTQRSALEYTQSLPSLAKGPSLQVNLFCLRQTRVCRVGNPSQTMPKSHQAKKKNTWRALKHWVQPNPEKLQAPIIHRCDQRKLLCIVYPVTSTETPSAAETQTPALPHLNRIPSS